MWPLTGLEIVQACAGVCTLPRLDELRIGGVKADGAPPAPDDLFVALREPAYDFDSHGWVPTYLRAGAALALVAADWPLLDALPPALRQRCIVVADSLRAFRQLAAWLRRRFAFPVIAVGGSNGKTTTKDMIAALLSGPGFRVSKTPENLNGYSGIALTVAQRAHTRAAPPHALVVEIGIDGPRAMAEHTALLAPDVAVLTALGPEHLLRLGSWDTAVAEELGLFAGAGRRRIFQAQDAKVHEQLATVRRGDVIVCDEDKVTAAVRTALGRVGADFDQSEAARPSPQLMELLRRGVSVLTFGVTCREPLASEVELTWYEAAARAESPWRGCFHVPMAGRHNADNFAAAFGAALAVGRTPDELRRGWPSFEPPAMRCQTTALPDGGILIDDTYNASPSSMAAAFALLRSCAWRARRKVLILGDMLDLGESAAAWHRALGEPLRTVENAQIFLFGDNMRELHRALAGAARLLPTAADPCTFLAQPAAALAGAVVLVKASRGMRLDRVVAQILRDTGEPAPAPPGKLAAGRWELQFADEKNSTEKAAGR